MPVDRPELRLLPFASVTSFDLPLSAESLLLLSRGPNSGGSVEIVTSTEQDRDVVTVEVVVRYIRQVARNDAKVCLVLTEDGGIGVGIFVSRIWKVCDDCEVLKLLRRRVAKDYLADCILQQK